MNRYRSIKVNTKNKAVDKKLEDQEAG
jgi:hypothetical protein